MFQRWARAYCDDKFHAAVDTNYGVEAMNKTLKYNYLPRGKNITVSQLVVTLTEEFLPEMLRKYQKQNIATSGYYRSYNDFVPKYLRERPWAVILHCLSRIKKASKFRKESVKETGEAGTFLVTSPSGKLHEVKISNGSGLPECTCKDWTRWHISCKHLFAIFTHTSWNWSDLPSSYRQNEYLCADSEALVSSVVDDDHNNDDGQGDGDMIFPEVPDHDIDGQDFDMEQCSHELPKHKVISFICKCLLIILLL